MPDIPETQKAQVNVKGKLEYKDIPVPKPGKDQVLVKIHYSGVCHTDLHALNGDWPFPPNDPLVGGHEGAGEVVQVGELVDGVKVGDYVGIKWINGTCLACEFCERGEEILCQKPQLSGYTVDGSFQQYCLGQSQTVAKLPKDIDMAAVAPILCAGITVYKGLKTSEAKPGQTVAIVGAGGGLGSIATQYAKAMGLRVIGIDGGDEKKDMVLNKLGAEAFVDFTKSKDLVADVKAATRDGLGPHAAILVATSEKPFQQAGDYVRPGGVVVPIGLPPGANIVSPVFWGVLKTLRIKCSYVGTRTDSAEAIDFFVRGLIKAPYKVVPLKELPKVYEDMHEGKIAGRVVLKMFDD